MADYNINLTIQNIWQVFRVFIDVGIMWVGLYFIFRAARNNLRIIQIAKGIIALLALNGIAKLLGLSTLTYFTDIFLNWGLLAIIIIFQPEIRLFLEKIGKSNTFSRMHSLLSNEREKLAEQVYEATIALSESKTGALIAIEQSQSLQDYISTGIKVNAEVSKELICSIFMTTTPLHDGAVIIRGDRVACASAYFPPTNVNLSSRYGARHRAALGIAEVSDALTIVVSEETSAVSIAENGRIFSVDEKQLKDYLRRVICNDTTSIDKNTRRRNSLLEIELDENDKEESNMKVPLNNRLKYSKQKNVKEETPKEDDNVVLSIKDNLNKENENDE